MSKLVETRQSWKNISYRNGVKKAVCSEPSLAISTKHQFVAKNIQIIASRYKMCLWVSDFNAQNLIRYDRILLKNSQKKIFSRFHMKSYTTMHFNLRYPCAYFSSINNRNCNHFVSQICILVHKYLRSLVTY